MTPAEILAELNRRIEDLLDPEALELEVSKAYVDDDEPTFTRLNAAPQMRHERECTARNEGQYCCLDRTSLNETTNPRWQFRAWLDQTLTEILEAD